MKTFHTYLNEQRVLSAMKNLGIPRAAMPQIGDRLDSFRDYMKESGIPITFREIPLAMIRMTQNELDLDKVTEMNGNMPLSSISEPFPVSEDYYLVDGHHRYMALHNRGDVTSVGAWQFGLTIEDLLAAAKTFDETSFEDIDGNGAEHPDDLSGPDPDDEFNDLEISDDEAEYATDFVAPRKEIIWQQSIDDALAQQYDSLAELFSVSSDWSWMKQDASQWVARFQVDLQSFTARIAPPISASDIWHMTFFRSERETLDADPGAAQVFRTFATVIEIAKDFLAQVGPETLVISGIKNSNTTKGRIFFYMVKRFRPDLDAVGYLITVQHRRDDIRFFMRKKAPYDVGLTENEERTERPNMRSEIRELTKPLERLMGPKFFVYCAVAIDIAILSVDRAKKSSWDDRDRRIFELRCKLTAPKLRWEAYTFGDKFDKEFIRRYVKFKKLEGDTVAELSLKTLAWFKATKPGLDALLADEEQMERDERAEKRRNHEDEDDDYDDDDYHEDDDY